MKCFFSLASFALALHGISQTYNPMLDSLVWVTQTSGFTGSWYTWNQPQGDTLIGSNTYTIYQSGFLREDTIARRVYKWDVTNSVDILLYDFTLNVGDTFYINSPTVTVNQNAIVTGKDSVLTYAGYRDRWFVLWYDGIGNPFTMVIIESVGSIVDPILMICPGYYDPQWYATCFYHNGVKTYGSLCPTYLTNFQFFVTPASCGECNGSVQYFATYIPDTVQWSLPQYSWTVHGPPFVGGLCAQQTGTVVITQTSTNFQYIDFFYIQDNPPAVIQTSNSSPASCQSCCDGSITVSASAGTPPYSYSWIPNVSITNTANGLCPGNYTVTVTDSAGCTSTDTLNISFSTNFSGFQIGTSPEPNWFTLSDVSGRKIWEGESLSEIFSGTRISHGIYIITGFDKTNQILFRQKVFLHE